MTATVQTLVQPAALAAALAGPHPPLVIETSFDLADTDAGESSWRQARSRRA